MYVYFYHSQAILTAVSVDVHERCCGYQGSKKLETVKTTPSGTQLVERHTQPASITAKRQANTQVHHDVI